MGDQTRFVGVRLSVKDAEQLLLVSLQTENPGNMSTAVRWLLDQSKQLVQQRLGEGERYEVLNSLAQQMVRSKIAKSKGEVGNG